MLRDSTAEERKQIEKYLQLDEAYLYSLIPPYLEPGGIYDFQGQVSAGKRLFESMQSSIRARLCEEWALCAKIDHPSFKDATNIVVVIGDVLSTTISGIPPFLVASLLVKIGLRKFCEC